MVGISGSFVVGCQEASPAARLVAPVAAPGTRHWSAAPVARVWVRCAWRSSKQEGPQNAGLLANLADLRA
jgi:hypothetical protein